MEEEIDLREYINVIIRHWYWIVGLALVAAVVAFVVSSFLPPTYEATAMVIITRPRYVFQFDERMQDIPFDPTLLSNGYPTMATSDDLLLSVAQKVNSHLPPENQSPGRLRKMLTAQTVGDSNLTKLTAQSDDPQEAASLANTWAQQFVEYLNDVYGGKNDAPLFEAQVAEARTALEEADYALAVFRGEYGMGFYEGQDSADEDAEPVLDLGIARRLQAKTDLLMQYETRGDRITQLLGEARMAAVGADKATSPAIVAGLLADILQLGVVDAETSPRVQISLADLDASANLLALITALEAKQNSTSDAIARLAADVETLQSELAVQQQELDQLLRDREVAENTYLTLANKLQEVRIEAQDENGDTAKLLSHAAVPDRPVSPRRKFNAVLAGALGFMIGVFGVLFIEYWRREPLKPASSSKSASEQVSVG